MSKLGLEDRSAVCAILREAGFSGAWLLLSHDRTEYVFMVPANELPDGIEEAPETRLTVLALVKILPHAKVWVGRHRDGLEAVQLY